MQYRIGNRDPVTGLYDVIWPDGSFTRNGIKIFNSAYEFGDVVLATQRSDGMLILDGVKAVDTPQITSVSSSSVQSNFSTNAFAVSEGGAGYLNGQVFNQEEEISLGDIFTIKCRIRDFFSGRFSGAGIYKFYASNIERSELRLKPVGTFNAAVVPDELLPLDSLSNLVSSDLYAFATELGATVDRPLYLYNENRDYDYLQFSLKAAQSFLNQAGYRYLVVVRSVWWSRLDEISPFNTFSLQVSNLAINNEASEGTPSIGSSTAAADDLPYLLARSRTFGWIEWLWRERIAPIDPVYNPVIYGLQLNAVCVQIDMQNLAGIKFLTPVTGDLNGFTGFAGVEHEVIGVQPQVINL